MPEVTTQGANPSVLFGEPLDHVPPEGLLLLRGEERVTLEKVIEHRRS
jgi:hypothetical protein